MRYGLQTLVIFPSHTYGLATDERTLPQALKEAGYKTLMIGKWHLGHADKKYWPQNRGFDHFYGNVMGEVNYFTRERGGVIDWQRNGKFLDGGGLLHRPDRRRRGQADRRAGRQASRSSSTSRRWRRMRPIRRRTSYVDRYKSFPDKQRRSYVGMITALDDQIGRIVAALDKKGLRDNTIILFASDNGGATSGLFASGSKSKEERDSEEGGIEQGAKAPASNAPFRGGKGSLHEGGVRVPAFVNWPAKLKPRVVNEPLHMVDVMPTLLALAGGKGSPDHPFDGKDMWKTLAEGAPSPERRHPDQCRGVPRRHSQGRLEARSRSRCCPARPNCSISSSDPGETTNVADENPEIVARSRSAPAGLCQGAEAEPVDQGAAGLRGRAGQDGHRPGLRHRRRRPAAREARHTQLSARAEPAHHASVFLRRRQTSAKTAWEADVTIIVFI